MLISAIAFSAFLANSNAAAAPTISPRRLLEVIDIGNPVVSPDGRYVAYRTEQASVERNTYDTVWYVQTIDGKSPPVRIANGGTPSRQPVNGVVWLSPAIWSPDGQWIYFRALLDGRMSVWRAATDGSGSREITIDPADVRAFNLSDDGKRLIYSVGPTREAVERAEQAEYDDGVRVDETIVLAEGLSRSTLVEGRPATQRFLGDWFSTGPLLAETPDRWKEIKLSTMTTRDLSEADRPPMPAVLEDFTKDFPGASKFAINPTDARVALLVPSSEASEGRPTTEIVLVDRLRSHKTARCTAALCNRGPIAQMQWRPGTNELLFTVTEYDRSQTINVWNVISGEVRTVVRSQGLVTGSQRYWDSHCALSPNVMVCVAAEADHPPRLEAIDPDSGERRVLFAPNAGLDADIASTVPARLIQWTDEQGRLFTGRLFEAKTAGSTSPPPLFVTFYNCYGFLRGGVGDEWPLASFAEEGISALCINGLPKSYSNWIQRHDQGRTAIEAIAARLGEEGRIDPERVGIGGFSIGSEIASWVMMNSDVITAASLGSPAVTPSWYLMNSLREAFRFAALDQWQLGSLEETPEQWRTISPAFNLDKLRAPVLFQLPEREYLWSLDYALPLVRRRQGELYAFPQEPHIKFQPRHKLTVYERNIDWFRFWLQNYEDPDPRKANQYQHWREMRAARDAGRWRSDQQIGAGANGGS